MANNEYKKTHRFCMGGQECSVSHTSSSDVRYDNLEPMVATNKHSNVVVGVKFTLIVMISNRRKMIGGLKLGQLKLVDFNVKYSGSSIWSVVTMNNETIQRVEPILTNTGSNLLNVLKKYLLHVCAISFCIYLELTCDSCSRLSTLPAPAFSQ